jgi:hypothetical protein
MSLDVVLGPAGQRVTPGEPRGGREAVTGSADLGHAMAAHVIVGVAIARAHATARIH